MRFRFGDYELDEDRFELTCSGERITIQPKPLELLRHLLQRHPAVVTKDELLDALWPDAAVTESSLTRAVRAARRSMGETADSEGMIRTVRGRGYAIAVPVDAADASARSESPAAPGGVAVSDAMMEPVRDQDAEDDGEQRLESVVAPIVRDPSEDLKTSEGGAGRERSRRERELVGREAPLAELEAALDDAEAGRGTLAFLVGEPGIGKTRTAEELALRATARGTEVLWGRCMEGQGAPALWPWVQILRAAVQGRDAETLQRQLGSRAPFIAEVVSEVRDKLPDLPEATRHDSEEGRFRFHDGLARFLARAAEQRTLVLVIEDLHWADSSSLQLLRFLAPELDSSRVLILLTYRDVAAEPGAELDLALSDLARLPHARSAIPLRGLTREDVGRLIWQATGVEPRAGLLESLHARTEGNPFFVSELIRLMPSGGDPDAAARTPIPSSVKAVVRQRAAALSETGRRLMQAAAVIGRDVPAPLLAAVLGQSENEFFDALDSVEASGLLAEHTDDPEQLRFSHALVQETLYDALSRRERVSLHRKVGEAIEALHSPKVDPFLPALAHHFRQSAFGEQFEKAVDYLERAARQAHSQLAFERAAELCADAIRLLEARGPGDERRHALLLLAQGRALIESGRPPEGQALVWRAIEVAREVRAPEIIVDAARHLVGNNYTSAFGEELMQVLDEALEQLGPDQESRRVVGLCARNRAGYFILPIEELEGMAGEAVERARAVGDTDTLRWALGSWSSVHFGALDLEARRRHLDEWLERAREARDSLDEFLCRTHCLNLSFDTIDPTLFERSLDACDRLSMELRRRPIVEGPLSDARAAWLLGKGQLEEAERLNAHALDLNQRADQARAFGSFAIKLGLIRFAQGRLGEFEPLMNANMDALAPWMRTHTQVAVGHIDIALGRPEKAGELLNEALASGPVGRRDLLSTSTVALAGDLAEALDDVEAARRIYDLGVPFAGRCAHAYVMSCWGSVDRALGLCAKTLGRLDVAEHHFENSLAIDRRMGFRLFEVMTLTDHARLRLLRDEGDDARIAHEQLGAAMRTADEIGAKGFAERARTLLG